MSDTDIDKGTPWGEEITTAWDTMKAGVICLTRENLAADWLLFEAGALYNPREKKSRVWTYLLFGLTIPDVTGPLSMLQATKAEEEDTRKLVHSINKNLDGTVEERRVDSWFDKFWPDLKNELKTIPEPSGVAPPKRSADEMAADTLELLRSVAPLIQDIAIETSVAREKRMAQEEALKLVPFTFNFPMAEGLNLAKSLYAPISIQSSASPTRPPSPNNSEQTDKLTSFLQKRKERKSKSKSS